MQLFTSINPNMSRSYKGQDVSKQYQKECIRSWINTGFHLVSLNNNEEAQRVREDFPEIQVFTVDGRLPKIKDFIAAAAEERLAGIVNGDCLFTGDETVARRIREFAARGLLMMERVNLEPDTLLLGNCCRGFDAFFFSTDILQRISMNNELQIGDTWWDYVFPLSYRAAGGQLFQSSSFLCHLNHPVAWNDANYVSGGLIAKSMFSGTQGLPVVESDDIDALGHFASEVISLLRTVPEQINLRGPGLAAEISDRMAWSVQAATELRPSVPPIEVNVEEIARKAVEEYRLNRPSAPGLGELLCTAAFLIRKVFPGSRMAEALFRAGDDLQFPLYGRTTNGDPRP